MHNCLQKSANVIGHVPQKISTACSIFIQREGTLTCTIIDFCRQYSADLPQSSLQIPCKLEFKFDNANNNYYMRIILAKFKFGGLIMIRQVIKFSFLPKFVVIQYFNKYNSIPLLFSALLTFLPYYSVQTIPLSKNISEATQRYNSHKT